MEHRWGQRSAVNLPAAVRGLLGASEAVGLILNLSISGALVQTALDVNPFTGIEVNVNREWLLAWVTRRASSDVLAVEWMTLAPDAVVRQLEKAARHLAAPHALVVV